jgi:hypothetical protein
MNPAPLRVLETPETERIHDLHTRVEHLTVWQLRELAHIMTGRDPDLVESTLRVLPRACRSCGQMVPLGSDSNGRPL